LDVDQPPAAVASLPRAKKTTSQACRNKAKQVEVAQDTGVLNAKLSIPSGLAEREICGVGRIAYGVPLGGSAQDVFARNFC
jgi:hypothetical protein